jgi:hypothetical protein
MTTITPTHSCFDDAMEFFEIFDLNDPEVRAEMFDSLRLVHGLCYSVANGVRYAHGWIEERVPGDDPDRQGWPEHVVWQGMAHDGGRAYFAVERTWFYGAYSVESRTVYRIDEVVAQNQASGHYGPWDPRYRAHTGGGGRIFARIEDAPVLGVLEMPRSP